MTDDPNAKGRRAHFPSEYGAPEYPNERMPWEWVVEQIEGARNYWIASVRPSGVPHVRPVDGVWVSGALCFGGSPETRWARNITANPSISVNLPSDEVAIILEGDVERVTDAQHPLAEPSAAASFAKYPQYGAPQGFQPFWALQPSIVYAWTLSGFPNRATRWTFEK